MRRKGTLRKSRPTFAFVVDGETEIWYLQLLKQNEANLRLSIKPEIPQKKKLEDQFKTVVDLAVMDYSKVFWIVDLDTYIKENRELKAGVVSPLIELEGYKSKLYEEHDNVIIIVNNPCLEFWFLLHFKKTSRYYRKCADVLPDLKKHLVGYKKTEVFFKKRGNDIYRKLKPYLRDAFNNATALEPFDIQNAERAMCEMHELFNCEEFKQCLKS